eukprot:IDg6688t1
MKFQPWYMGVCRSFPIENRIMSIVAYEVTAAQRIRVDDGARVETPVVKKLHDGPTTFSMRISLDGRYQYALLVRAEGIDIVSVVGGKASLTFTDMGSTRSAKIVVVILFSRRKTGYRSLRTSNPEAGEYDAQYIFLLKNFPLVQARW